MINEERLKHVVAGWMENSYWRSKLESAPTALSRRATELEFYHSALWGRLDEAERKEVFDALYALRERFCLEDWKHALRYCGVNPFRSLCCRKIKELEEKARNVQASDPNKNEGGKPWKMPPFI